MRTSSTIFGILFLALGIFATGCALLIPEAGHQWYLAGICWTVAFVLLADASKKIDALAKRNLNL